MVRSEPKPEDKAVNPIALMIGSSDCVTSSKVVRLDSALRPRSAPPADTRRVVCLHVLSSFQRTESSAPCDFVGRLGNLPNLRSAPLGCQQENQHSLIFFSPPFPADEIAFRWRRLRQLRKLFDACLSTSVSLPRTQVLQERPMDRNRRSLAYASFGDAQDFQS